MQSIIYICDIGDYILSFEWIVTLHFGCLSPISQSTIEFVNINETLTHLYI